MGCLIDQGEFDSQGKYIKQMGWDNPKREEYLFLYGLFCYQRAYLEYLFTTKDGIGVFTAFWPFITIVGWFFGLFVFIGRAHDSMFNKAVKEKLESRAKKSEEGKVEIFDEE